MVASWPTLSCLEEERVSEGDGDGDGDEDEDVEGERREFGEEREREKVWWRGERKNNNILNI